MKPSRISLSAGVSLAFFFAVSQAIAQSYGQQDQVLTIGAAEFQNKSEFDYYYILDDGYLYSGNIADYAAPLSLPEGSLIQGFCLYAFDQNPAPFATVSAGLYAVKLVPGGEAPIVKVVSTVVDSGSDIGYGDSCSLPISYTIRSKLDLDGDGVPDAVVYYVIAHIVGENLGLGAVQITWKRQVSPPPATPSFGDVPPSDLAFPYVEALVASGVTAGCGNNNYCPGAPLTRRQMAVFLAKALGLHWAD